MLWLLQKRCKKTIINVGVIGQDRVNKHWYVLYKEEIYSFFENLQYVFKIRKIKRCVLLEKISIKTSSIEISRVKMLLGKPCNIYTHS